MVDQDYADILDYHVSHQNEITVVVALLNVKIPYGVLNTDGEGQLESLSEKPELFYKINTGLYVLEPSVLLDIPSNTVFHITDLIELLVSQRRKVGVFPVSEKSWTDMGNWDEFLKQANIKQKQ
jgi:NDP-sugar pyrophosphorylase family protein